MRKLEKIYWGAGEFRYVFFVRMLSKVISATPIAIERFKPQEIRETVNVTHKRFGGPPHLETAMNGIRPETSEENRGGEEKSLAQFLYVRFVQITLPMQDFRHNAFRAKDGDQILLPEIISIHQRTEDFYR